LVLSRQAGNPPRNASELNNISPSTLCLRANPELDVDFDLHFGPEPARQPLPPPKRKRKRKCKITQKAQKLVARVCRVVAGVRMSDASPSKRRKTKGALIMKTKNSAGKQFSITFAEASVSRSC
jgi:hypothetical protein